MARPTLTLEDIRAYLGESSATDDAILSAYDAEAAAQGRRCNVPDTTDWSGYEDLREALLRRIARNLAARAVPLATWDPGVGISTRVTSTDAAVDRLEAPHRRLVVA